ncbi:exodeoxyribonuclease VII large subunit [Spirulina sp. CCNP1310]|uniref:exodeoxyribonuclease VII large subunit n=1 Tax=Spirulina sp. CCNP1310 TaxID=3110249 RepID=UPI002B1F30BD|nr:exodeoxyribonuclease VII large subunit [Spirulina sp. CCNP1310]MEA5419433.1 exodeoxyribonuclease VII large subunit [Spirulina sp. CCNP1310]
MDTLNNALSVAGLTDYLKSTLEEDPNLRHIWVVGEVTAAKQHPVGLFLTLGDPDAEAQIQGVVWNGVRSRLKHQPRPGERVAVLGSLSLYSKRGEYRLQIVQILPQGEGFQALRLQQLRSRLAAEGLFDPLQKRPLPPHPQTIAVITAPTAAAWGDIQRTISSRNPGITLLFAPATVQGEQAPPSIAAAFAQVERDGRAEVVILARGGGATEDLACFNDERVVRAIAECTRPVVTGIGHERDQTLADLVADVSVHTPTAAAEWVVPLASQQWREHQQRGDRLHRAFTHRLNQEQNRLTQLKTRLGRLPHQAHSLQQARIRHQILREKLAALDPHGVLQRGYAIAQYPQGGLPLVADLRGGETLILHLADGQVEVRVMAIGTDPKK